MFDNKFQGAYHSHSSLNEQHDLEKRLLSCLVLFFNRLITDKCGNEASYTCLIRDERSLNVLHLCFVSFFESEPEVYVS